MHPILVYLLLILGGTAIWCATAHAWVVAAILWVLACWLLCQWASVKVSRAIHHHQFQREVRALIALERRTTK